MASNRTATRQISKSAKPSSIPVGVIGLGLMGSSITTCLLAAGHPVAGIELDELKRKTAPRRILLHLKEMKAEGSLRADPAQVVKRLRVSGNVSALKGSELVVESIIENIQAKTQVIRQAEQVLAPTAIIGSNTSAIPVSLLQKNALHPQRILGIHWAEPAHTTRFLEIVCGKQTHPKYAERVRDLASGWGKEPSVLRRDIRGFIANRCFYALLREAFYLVEAGYASVEDVDRCIRNDMGFWTTFSGPFRFLDLTGIPAYREVMKDLFPELSCSRKIPALMEKLVKSGARGVTNAKGFYRYTPQQAKRWEKLFLDFSFDIQKLAQKYPVDVGDRSPHRRKG
jgi:3-hydroxybutyryl-CoA dehydrogenase